MRFMQSTRVPRTISGEKIELQLAAPPPGLRPVPTGSREKGSAFPPVRHRSLYKNKALANCSESRRLSTSRGGKAALTMAAIFSQLLVVWIGSALSLLFGQTGLGSLQSAPHPVSFTAEQDHQNMSEQLGI